MRNVVIAVHGGAGSLSPYLKKHLQESKEGIKEALACGYERLKKGRSALSAVEAAVIKLEDNYLFNAGRGSALNIYGEVEMDASIMDGKRMRAGAVSLVHQVRNPIILARHVMTKTKHVFLSGSGALELACLHKIKLEPESYFITDHQFAAYQKAKERSEQLKSHGTVGAVAMDLKGNMAAATSTGGTAHCLRGRIGDSCIIGAGCYANNKTCAISCTGQGELIITGVIAHTISMLVEFNKWSIEKAVNYVIHKRSITPKGDMGLIALDRNANLAMSFNTTSMRRGYVTKDGKMTIDVY